MKNLILDYDLIAIIYNPNSTGAAEDLAKELNQQLTAALSTIQVELLETTHAGHGEEIAYDLASRYKKPVIISVSGDGGYNDVINGAIKAAEEFKTSPICAVRGAGNANDHRRTLKEMPLFEAILSKNLVAIDLLKVEIMPNNEPTYTRYAHSYAGLGLTPEVAVELNKYDLSRIKELIIVAKAFRSHKPFTIKLSSGAKLEYDNILFANINQMAKVVTLSTDGHPADGEFEFIATHHTSKIAQLGMAAKAALKGMEPVAKLKEFEFGVVKKMPMQLDGEIVELKRGTKVRVTIAAGKLRTLV